MVVKVRIFQRMARHAHYVVLCSRSTSVSNCDQYSMSLFELSRCDCNDMHPTWTSHASVYRVIPSLFFGSAKTGCDMSASVKQFIDILIPCCEEVRELLVSLFAVLRLIWLLCK